MLHTIRLLGLLWILCLPVANYGAEIKRNLGETVESISVHTNRTRHHHDCRTDRVLPRCQGPQGPQGPSSIGTLSYGDFYLSVSDDRTINPGEIIPVQTARAGIITNGLSLDSSTGGVAVSVPGIYNVSYVVTFHSSIPTDPIAYTTALQLDGTLIPGSIRSVLDLSRVTSAPDSILQIQGESIVSITSGQVLSIVNADTSPINIVPAPDSPQDIEQVSLIIRKIDSL